MTLKLSISQPCSEKWENMLPSSDGRFCDKCSTDVIDFSSFSDVEIQNFFIENRNGVCGRFYRSQIERIEIKIPKYVLFKRMQSWKKFMLVFLICFGSSVLNFDTKIQGSFLCAQTIHPRKKAVFSKKKKVRIYRNKANLEEISLPTASVLMGATQVDVGPDRMEYQFTDQKITFSRKETNSSIKIQESTLKKPIPSKRKRFLKSEFVLPSTSIRKKLRKSQDR